MTDRELDALVAEKVMGWGHYGADDHTRPLHTTQRIAEQEPRPYDDWGSKGPHDRLVDPCGGDFFLCGCASTAVLPDYSTDIGAAWEVVEKMPYRFSVLRGTGMGETFKAEFWIEDTGERVGAAYAPTAPRAICLAALRAVGVEA